MTTTRSVALLVALAVGLTVAPLAGGAVVSPFAEPAAGQSETGTTNASVGTLLQASAADTENTVDAEQFEAAYENADNESRLLTDRTTELESRLAELEAERDRLEASYENDSISKGTYQSRMATVTVEIASLEHSIERTERHAAEAGVAQERLATLRGNAADARQDASERAGPGVRDVARGLANGGGPPDDAGPPSKGDGAGSGPATGPGEGAPGNGPGNAIPDESPAANGSDAQTEATGSDGEPAKNGDGQQSGAPASESDSTDGTGDAGSDSDSDDDTTAGGD